MFSFLTMGNRKRGLGERQIAGQLERAAFAGAAEKCVLKVSCLEANVQLTVRAVGSCLQRAAGRQSCGKAWRRYSHHSCSCVAAQDHVRMANDG